MSGWFEDLFGFAEGSWEETRAHFALEGETLRSRANERRFGVGRFATPTLAELRQATAGARPGTLRVRHEVVGDALALHGDPAQAGALFQVASQHNCLEFPGPETVPEDGITEYEDDPTQGPACALAAAPATVFRNYFVPLGDHEGQRRDRQVDTLGALRAHLGEDLVDMVNGYAESDPARLAALRERMAGEDADALRARVGIGLQRGVEVVYGQRYVPLEATHRVSQAFCSAIACAYSAARVAEWEPLARIVLEASYEATLLAAVLDAAEGQGSGRVWLTFLGGGAFGNPKAWIAEAMVRALRVARERELDVRIAHHQRLDEGLVATLADTGLEAELSRP
ncbi:MAG: hypothetical protein AAGH15_23205 [Myxococcota bacterium]